MDVSDPRSRLAAMWRTTKRLLARARASRHYGRAERFALEVLVMVLGSLITSLLIGMLPHGR